MSGTFFTASGLAGADDPASWEITWGLNTGWTGSLGYGKHINIRSVPTTELAIYFNDGISLDPVLAKSGLLMRGRKRRWSLSEGYTANLSLIDKTSNALASGNISFDTFSDSTFAEIASAIASETGVSISGAPSDPVLKEDVKQSTGWAPLQRMAAAAGMDLEVGTNGALSFVSQAPDGSADFDPDEVEEDYSPLDQIGKILVQKRSGMGTYGGPQYYDFTEGGYTTGQLDSPLNGALPVDESAQGSVGWVGFWDGPPTGAGKLISLHPMNGETADALTVPLDGVNPATHFSCNVYPSKTNNTLPVQARLRVNGSSPITIPAGIDPAFSVLGTGSTPNINKGFPRVWNEPLIPSEAYAQARIDNYLAQLNRGTDLLRAAGPARSGLRLRQSWSWDGATGRIISITWRGGAAQAPRAEIVCELT